MAPDLQRRRLFVALVLTGRPAAEIDGLRRALQPALIDRVAPHVTLVPPRNVAAANDDAVALLLQEVAAREAPLQLVLGPAATFWPRTPVVYLSCADGDSTLRGLARRLATGPFAPPAGRSERPFVPHVTLANRVENGRAPALAEMLGSFRLEAPVEELTLLAQEPGPPHAWRSVATYALGGRAVVATGGLALELFVMARPDAEIARFLDEVPHRQEGGGASGAGTPVVVAARREGALVGAGSGVVFDGVLEIHGLSVAAHARRQGIATRVLAHLERHALGCGATLCRVVVPARGQAESFFRARGYRTVAELGAWFGEHDGVALVRGILREDAGSR